jgi:hypothetical protein
MFRAKNNSRASLIRECLRRLERIWRRLPTPAFDSYRPEKHYALDSSHTKTRQMSWVRQELGNGAYDAPPRSPDIDL